MASIGGVLKKIAKPAALLAAGAVNPALAAALGAALGAKKGGLKGAITGGLEGYGMGSLGSMARGGISKMLTGGAKAALPKAVTPVTGVQPLSTVSMLGGTPAAAATTASGSGISAASSLVPETTGIATKVGKGAKAIGGFVQKNPKVAELALQGALSQAGGPETDVARQKLALEEKRFGLESQEYQNEQARRKAVAELLAPMLKGMGTQYGAAGFQSPMSPEVMNLPSLDDRTGMTVGQNDMLNAMYSTINSQGYTPAQRALLEQEARRVRQQYRMR